MRLTKMASKQKRNVQGYKNKLEEKSEDKARNKSAAKPIVN